MELEYIVGIIIMEEVGMIYAKVQQNRMGSKVKQYNLILMFIAVQQQLGCGGSTCGVNARCTRDHKGEGRPVCSCFPKHIGDPLFQCTPVECVGKKSKNSLKA